MQQITSNPAQNTLFKSFTTIPAEVKNLGINAKLMVVLSEILALAKNSDQGICFASNKHFANLISRSKSTASRAIKELRTLGLLSSKLIYKNDSKQVLRRDVTATLHDKEAYNAKKSRDDRFLDKKITKIFESYPVRLNETRPAQITPIAYDAIKNGINELAFIHCITKIKAAEKMLYIVNEFAKIVTQWGEEKRRYQYGVVSFMDKREFTNEFTNWRRFIQKAPTTAVIDNKQTSYANQALRDQELEIKQQAAELDSMMLKKRYDEADKQTKHIVTKYIKHLEKATGISITADFIHTYLDEALNWHNTQ